ncbi:hypothetical protein MMC26_002842 [Xylographa opegraphella]|nr:hypothetical protein [Xylographa opegraphella]
MRECSLLGCVLLVTAVDAALLEGSLGPRHGHSVVSFDTTRARSSIPSQLRRRQHGGGDVTVGVQNGLLEVANPVAQYFVNLTIGTPTQMVTVQLDTGSNDLVLNSAKSAFCEEQPSVCAGATYSANSSSTYQYLSSNASLGYGGGDLTSGDYAMDTVRFGDTSLNDVQMVLSYNTTTPDSIWGLSYSAGEQGTYKGENQYPSISELMVSSGAIQSNAYSLWLNTQNSTTGSLIFGGVNKGKYSGPLNTIPIENNPNYTTPSGFIVTVTGIGLTLSADSRTNAKANTSIPLVTKRADPFLIDSGTYNIELPLAHLQPILTALGAEYEAASEYAMVPCSMTSNTSTIDFEFTSFSISIPLTELIFPQDFLAYDNYIPTLRDGKTPACLLGMQPSGEDMILGDTFMRSAYMVFDLDNNEISLAQANVGAQADDIVEITSGKNSVPGATRVVNPVRAFENETAVANYDVPATGTWSFYETVSTTVSATGAPKVAGTTGIAPTGTGKVTAASSTATSTATATGSAAAAATAATAATSKAMASRLNGHFLKACLVAIVGLACLL